MSYAFLVLPSPPARPAEPATRLCRQAGRGSAPLRLRPPPAAGMCDCHGEAALRGGLAQETPPRAGRPAVGGTGRPLAAVSLAASPDGREPSALPSAAVSPPPAGARPRRAVGLRSAGGGAAGGAGNRCRAGAGRGARATRAAAAERCPSAGAVGRLPALGAGPRGSGGSGSTPCPRPERVGARAAPLLPAVPADGVRLRVIGLTLALTYAGGRGTVLRPKAPWLWCSRKFCCEMSARVWWYAEGSSPGFLLSVVLCFNSFAVQLCELRG